VSQRKQRFSINWLQVFRRAKVAHLCSGGGPKRETRAVPSEQCVARWGSEYDEMRMITTSFARVLERCTGHLYMHFSLYFNRLDQFTKLATSYKEACWMYGVDAKFPAQIRLGVVRRCARDIIGTFDPREE